MGSPSKAQDQTPASRLETAVQAAVAMAKKARKVGKSLSSDNYYANRLFELRAEATNLFRDLSAQSAGDVTAMAEMIQTVFSPTTPAVKRLSVSRDLVFALRTTWHQPKPAYSAPGATFFPPSILNQTRRGYLISIGRQMNGAFANDWYDACAVMMRRLLETSIIEAFEGKGLAAKIKKPDGSYLQLSDLVGATLKEPAFPLTRNTRKYLPRLRDVGHLSAHSRFYLARREDIENIQQGCRIVIEELLNIAGLI